MNRPVYIIDGYNLIRRIPALNRPGASLEDQRRGLVSKLSGFRAASRATCLVVFDGTDLAGQTVSSGGGVRVVFSRKPSTADDVIKRLVDQEKNKGHVTVVTSDNEIMWYAKASGCGVLSAEGFYERIAARESDDRPEKKSDPQLSQREINDWKKLFDID